MKKTTLFTLVAVAILVAGSLFAKDQRIWNGSTNRIWDLSTSNWVDPSGILYPTVILPTNTVEGATAKFDDSTDSLNVKVSGIMPVDSILFNSTKNYVIDSVLTSPVKPAYLTGTGTLVKDGSGTLTLSARSTLLGGTVIKNGRLTKPAPNFINIYGAKLRLEGGIVNEGTAGSTSAKVDSLKVPIEIPAGKTGTIELARYSFLISNISGGGDLILSTGGERAMLGRSKSGSKIDWSKFSGNLTIQRYKATGVTVGNYGLLIPSVKTYDYTKLNTVDSLFWNKKVSLKSGAGITGCSGSHCWMFGELTAENDSSFVAGYGAGDSASPFVYWMIGSSNTDVVFPGTIKDAGSKNQNQVGIIKIGTGKYTFTSSKSITTASLGVEVKAGTLLVDIPVTKTTTALGRVKLVSNALSIRAGATGGGNGRITGGVLVDSLGTLVVGNNGVGQLVLGDTLTGTIKSPLTVSHYGKVVFKIGSKTSFDNISTNSTAIFNGGTILVQPAASVSLHDNDSLTILTTKSRTAVDSFSLKTEGFPIGTSISYSKDTIANSGYKITLIVHGNIAALVNPLDKSTISVYPNPTRGDVNISSSDAEIATIEILNLQGQSILRKNVRSTTTNINLNSLAPGVYYTKITTANGTKVQKLLKQ